MRVPIDLAALAARQDAVVTTAQVRALGLSASWVDRRVRDGQWQRLHRGVLVTHSGPVLWRTTARAALLYAGQGSALSHTAAGHVHGFADAPRVVDVVVPHERRVDPSRGVRVHRRREFRASGRLPTLPRGDTVLDLVAGARDEDAAIAVVCDALRARTSVLEVLDALERRSNAPGRALLVTLLAEADAGVESPLELRYHRRVGRAHGLPPARLQVRDVVDGRWIRSDCRYDAYGVRVELDGRLAHPGAATDADVWRDNAVLLSHADLTLRYRWRHVAGHACRTAAQVAFALTRRGWTDAPRPCGTACTVLA